MQENKIIPIMHCFDNNYVMTAGVAFLSLLKNANVDYKYNIYVLHTDITLENQNKLHDIVDRFPNASLEFINMENKFEELFHMTKEKGHYSKEMYYKFLAPSLFGQYDKIMILDVDVVYMGDVSKEFIEFNVEDDYYLAGHKGIAPKGTWLEDFYKMYEKNFTLEERKKILTNACYWIFNLKKLRKDNMEKKFIEFAFSNVDRLIQPEQDVVNLLCYPNVKLLPVNAVVCTYAYDLLLTDVNRRSDPFYSEEELTFALENPIQIHYATSAKPWKFPSGIKAELWFAYLAQTPFLKDYLEDQEQKYFFNNKLFFYKRRYDWLLKIFERFYFFTSIKISHRKKCVKSDPMVSILCCTYNHEKFIKKTLEGIINQKTEFPFEVIISDDASTDKTQEIIKLYADKYPHIIKTILRNKNVGVGQNYYEALCQVKGKYLAICDGDDYWLENNKIQKQISFLEQHQDYTVCCSDVLWHYEDNNKEDSVFHVRSYLPKKIRKKKYFTFDDLLTCRFIASSTCVLRWQMRDNVPIWLKKHCVIDFPITLIHSMVGKIKVFDEVFSQYNIHSKGVSRQDQTFLYKKKMDDILNYINIYSEGYKEKEIKHFLKHHGVS